MIFTLLMILLIYFLGFKKYHIRIKDVNGTTKDKVVDAFKYEIGLSLVQIEAVVNSLPYLLPGGKFLDTYVTVRKLRSAGIDCELFFRWFKKVEVGPENAQESSTVAPEASAEVTGGTVTEVPAEAPAEVGGELVTECLNEEAWKYADEAYNLAMRPLDEDQVAVAMTTPEVAMQVDALIDKAEAAAEDPYEDAFWDRITTLRDAVSWTLKRHFTHSWALIAGVFISVAFAGYYALEGKSNLNKAENQLARVKDWEKCDTTFAEFPERVNTTQLWAGRLHNAKTYKAYQLHGAYNRYLSSKESAEEWALRADTASSKDMKKTYLASQKESEKNAKKYLKEYEEWNEMKFRKVRAAAVDECKGEVKGAKAASRFLNLIFLLVFLMIPLYIMASYQYGYVQVKYEKEAIMLDKIRHWAYSVAAGLFGAGLMMQFLPDYIVTTRWSNGSVTKERETNPVNIIIMVLKLGLIIAAVVVLCVASFFLMAYSTVTGLYRNYDWKQIVGEVKARVENAQRGSSEKHVE